MILRNLLSPGKIGKLELKNRVIFPPMGTSLPDVGGFVSQKLIDYHVARAKGGCGLNIIEIASIHPTSKGSRTLGIYNDAFLPGMTRLASAIKEAGGKACLQLWHAGRQTNSSVTGMPIVSPSSIPCPLCQEMPHVLTKTEIHELVEAFGDASLRAEKAGFDAIELHGAHGYLIAQFMSGYSNDREDEYGGNFKNRMRFPVEVILNIRKKVGPDYPIIFRVSADEMVAKGIKIMEAKEIAIVMEAAGVNAVHVSIGVYQTLQYTVPPIDLPVAFNVDNAMKIKEVVTIPVIAVDRINDPILAEKILDERKADFISIGRGQLADPEFVNKAARNEFDSIVKCIACNQGCVDRIFTMGLPISCLRNPACGNESEFAFKPVDKKKRVLVIGGGPGGLEAATTMKRRGHDVILCEKDSHLGGQFYLAGVVPRKQEMMAAALQMGELAKIAGVEIRLQTLVNREIINEINPDEIVLATGVIPVIPNIVGIFKNHVVLAHDVLSGEVSTGSKVAIIGGGLVGLEVAELLAEQHKEVTVIEMADDIVKDMGFLRKAFTLEYVQKEGIQIFKDTLCTEIKDLSILIEKEGKQIDLVGINSVVIAAGAMPNNEMEETIKAMNIPYHVIGDARKPRKALEAIWEGAEVGRTI
ncbi:MAG: FAD-dependent oxidoreductase [Bacillus sp. (in: Bacteria)]|nr:FAD-dependent oxidoreductase [Bacillus sp. (in: firmicutes)]